MTVLDRKLLRELYHSGLLLLAITSIIAVGVGCYIAMGASYRNLSLGTQQYYAQCRMADFSVELKKAPIAEVLPLADIPGVMEIRPRIQQYTTVDLEDSAELINGLVLSLPDDRQPVLNDIMLRQGGYFTDRRDNEVIVNDAFARQHSLYPGQSIYVLLNNQRQELFIVGTAISSEFVYLLGPGAIVPDPAHFGVFYIKHTYAEDVFDFQGACNQVLGRLSPALRQPPPTEPSEAHVGPRLGQVTTADVPRAVLDQAEYLLDDFGVFSTTPLADQASNRFLSSEIDGLRTFGMVMPAIFLAVAAIVLNMLMSRLTEHQRVTVGTLKAMGYDDLQVFAHFLKFALAVGLLGGLFGCLLGYWMAGLMTSMYQHFFQFPNLVNRFYPDTWMLGIVISLLCALAGSLHGVRIVLRLEPAEAMRPKPPPQGGAIWLERITGFWNRLSFGWRMTLRNVIRHRLRTGAGLFAAAMGSALAVNSLMMAEATDYLIDFQFHQIQRSDVDLVFKDEQGSQALSELKVLPGVERAEPVFDVACTFVHGHHQRKGGISGLVHDAQLTIPRDTDGRPIPVPAHGLVMTRKLAELLHVDIGDSIEIHPVRGSREPKFAPIVGVTDSFLGLTVHADIDYLSRLMGEEMAMTGAQLKLDGIARSRRQLYRELKEMPALQAISARDDMIENLMRTLIQNQRVFIGMLVVFAGVIFFGSVLNMSLISLAEREREVATLQVLGYSPWQVGGLFLRESMLVNTAGTLVGLPLGYLLSLLVAWSYDTDWIRFPVVAPWSAWLAAVALGVTFALAAQAFVQRAILKMDWLDALKTKE